MKYKLLKTHIYFIPQVQKMATCSQYTFSLPLSPCGDKDTHKISTNEVDDLCATITGELPLSLRYSCSPQSNTVCKNSERIDGLMKIVWNDDKEKQYPTLPESIKSLPFDELDETLRIFFIEYIRGIVSGKYTASKPLLDLAKDAIEHIFNTTVSVDFPPNYKPEPVVPVDKITTVLKQLQ